MMPGLLFNNELINIGINFKQMKRDQLPSFLMLKYFAAPLMLLLVACSNNDNINSEPVTQINTVNNQAKNTFDTSARIIDLSGCYQMTIKQDTATLELNVKDSVVTGKLIYDWNQKDSNTGTIRGVVRGDLIHADYTFESEGMTSVREVIFKLEDSLLQQAVGDLDQQNNKIVYRNKSNLDFNVMPPFMKIDCSSKQ
jgi:hypothetical protein